MSNRRLPLGLIIIAPIAAGFGLYAFTGQAEVKNPNETPTTTASATVDASIATAIAADRTAFAATPTAVVDPSLTTPATASVRGEFHDGARVRVNTPGDCLNARTSPSTALDYVIVQTCLPHGHEGVLSGEAQQGDGYWWWYLAPYGWVVEEYLEYVGEDDLRQAQAPELAGFGRIAFVRDGDIWLMNADGSEQRMILDRPANSVYADEPYELHWSPDGTKIAFVVHTQTSESAFPQELQVIDASQGALLLFVPEADGVEWSPDSRTISTIRNGEVSMEGTEGIPMLVDVATGVRRDLAAAPFWMTRPPAFNHDGTKLLLTYATWDDAAQTGESAILIWDTHGRELDRLERGDGNGTFFWSPKWSPVDDRIAMHMTSVDGAGNVIYDLARQTIVASAAKPPTSTKAGGKCGSPDMFRMLWSRDAAAILFDFTMGDTNANGVWVWDIASGSQKLTMANAASEASPGPNGRFVFTSWGNATSHIVAGDASGGYARLITDGWAAAWAP